MQEISQNCIACMVCQKKCPYKAINMSLQNHFNHAYIDKNKCKECGLCKKVCPLNKEIKQNTPDAYVARIKNEENIEQSSSGGIFGEIARYVLANNGVAYGAGFDANFDVKHQRIDKISQLNKILKTKYVKSDVANSFELTKQDLEKGLTVLYSGTPCQISALKSFLQKDYFNLLTIDIVCHGVPSSIIWKNYINDLEDKYKSKIKSIDFRYNNKQDPNKNLLITFKNGKILNEVLYENTFGKAYLKNLISDDCCYNCNYNKFKNESDITIGDAWGYLNDEFPRKNSIIFINTVHGISIFNKIKNNLIIFKDANIKNIIINNYPIIHSSLKHINRIKLENYKVIDSSVLSLLNDELNCIEKDRKNVAILNFHYENYNYGANLVPFTLSRTIEKLGYKPYIIDFDPFQIDAITRYRTMGLYKFREKRLKLTSKIMNKNELPIMNEYFDKFIVGSDQVWRIACTGLNYDSYFLNFVDNNKTKISYSASFGNNNFEGNEDQIKEVSNYLKVFKAISVREKSGIDICKKLFDVDSTQHIDPTLLLSKNDYEKIIDEEYDEKIDVAVYFIMDQENKIMENKHIYHIFQNKKIVNIKGHLETIPFVGDIFVHNSVSKWLDGIRKCEYLLTDSYHGLIFGILFHKKVFLIGKNSAAKERYLSLFEILKCGIEQYFFENIDEIKSLDYDVNYKIAEKNIALEKEKSIDFLQNNLKEKELDK